jgi:predicted methyltransferase
VLDGTAGLGQDALHLAGWGAEVVAVERVPALGCLLEGFLRRAAADPEAAWGPAAQRIEVLLGAVEPSLAALGRDAVDVVFLDPMFEAPRAAAPGYDLFRRWASDAQLTQASLTEAIRAARERVVWKVPEGTAPPLEDLRAFNRRVTSKAFDYWIVEKALPAPEWAPLHRRRRPDPYPKPPAKLSAP